MHKVFMSLCILMSDYFIITSLGTDVWDFKSAGINSLSMRSPSFRILLFGSNEQ